MNPIKQNYPEYNRNTLTQKTQPPCTPAIRTFQEVGDILGISRQAAQQAEARALQKLRTILQTQRHEENAEGEEYAKTNLSR